MSKFEAEALSCPLYTMYFAVHEHHCLSDVTTVTRGQLLIIKSELQDRKLQLHVIKSELQNINSILVG